MQLKCSNLPGELAILIKQIIIFTDGDKIAVYYRFATDQIVELHKYTLSMKEEFKIYIKNLAIDKACAICSEGFQLEYFYTNLSDDIDYKINKMGFSNSGYTIEGESVFHAIVDGVKFRVGWFRYNGETWIVSYNLHSYNNIKPPPVWKYTDPVDARNEAFRLINLLISI